MKKNKNKELITDEVWRFAPTGSFCNLNFFCFTLLVLFITAMLPILPYFM